MQNYKDYVIIIKYQAHDSVAQLDRAFDYESKGQGFESLLGHQIKTHTNVWVFLYTTIEKRGYRTKSVDFIGDALSKLGL